MTRVLSSPSLRCVQTVEPLADKLGCIVERVDDPSRVAAITALVGSDEVVIADGHHRYAISRTYRDERRAERRAVARVVDRLDRAHRCHNACKHQSNLE
mgnify:CR=1 FL=1